MTPPPPAALPARGLVTVVLPAKNEEAALARTMRALPRGTLDALGLDMEVVVLDGQSVDATAAIGRRWGAVVITDREPGKGNAVRNAVNAFRGEYVVMLDADGTYPPDTIPRMLLPLLRGAAEVAVGDRVPQQGAMVGSHILGNVLLSTYASILYGRRCRDVCTGLWAFRADILRALPLQSRGFGLEAELFGLAARMRLRVAHVPFDYLPRHGLTKLNTGRDGLRILRRLFRTRLAPLPRLAPRSKLPSPHASPTPGEVQA